ncbi:MAG: hypothetical protein JRI68_09960 [Deltaproteobacteria bacterium]|nr:hypothetical protein [Deltaproteobacteria bacterium]
MVEVRDLIKKLLEEINAISKTETVVGEPLDVGKTKIIPISKLTIGFGVAGGNASGAGEGDSKAEGGVQLGGAGGGVKVQPMAFIAVDPDGGAQLLCLDEPEATVIDKLLTVAPELVERIAARIKGDEADPLGGKPAPKVLEGDDEAGE